MNEEEDPRVETTGALLCGECGIELLPAGKGNLSGFAGVVLTHKCDVFSKALRRFVREGA